MANYDRIKKLLVADDQTAEYALPICLSDDPTKPVVLICIPAGTNNKALTNAGLKMAQARPKKTRFDHDDLVVARGDNATLFPRFVIKGWRNVFDDDGRTAVPFSPDECEKLLRLVIQVDGNAFDDFCAWARELSNFRPDTTEAVAKN